MQLHVDTEHLTASDIAALGAIVQQYKSLPADTDNRERAAYIAWLTRAGLDERHAAVTGWIRTRAERRQVISSDLLQNIFMVLAGLSLLLIALPLFVKRERAPKRRALWLAALIPGC